MRVITSFDDLDPVPWANGAGETTELVSLADSRTLTPTLLRWRLSIARLDHPAAFSPLPGMERTFLPIGAEVVLDIDGQVHFVTQDQPQRFRGEQNVSLVELGAACFALNLMVETDDQAGSGQGGLEMSTRSTGSGLFAVTWDTGSGHPGFQLREFERSDVLPDHLGVAILH
ncbi:HutD family protein [Brevibacterium sp.]|uniref:HutD family protein n=1 Tax=Brevibacterium sp. TaxID=1701 RepID=UPI002649C1E6|nr:HutD family protein [Brevibacterium sp.]MDN6132631.1 HutD family protein [Brevibacterium sp.]MDN6158800.1 HutD family protein [Brevibacterium sp.]MDN6528202.1 HutD family protein [Brevibacterium sp.]MDN6603083.1 HutD family protein [Brevibacterium sp.]